MIGNGGDSSENESEINEDELQRLLNCYPNQEQENAESSDNLSVTASEMSFLSESFWSSDDNDDNGDIESDMSFSLWDDSVELEVLAPHAESESSEQEAVQWEYPRSNWNVWRAWKERQNGLKANMSSDWYGYKAMGSLHFVRRLTAMNTLEAHEGCVNCLSFDPTGRLLVSGSDDCRLVLWDWALGKPSVTVPSGHTHNIFQAKFTSGLDDGGIVTSAYDGQVRYVKVAPDGSVSISKRLVLHEEAAHSVCMVSHNPNVILSCGSDGYVFETDLREDETKRLFCTSDVHGISYPLYSIAAHPRKPEEFAIAGLSNYVLFFDRRRISDSPCAERRYRQEAEAESDNIVTSIVYSHDGLELLASYSGLSAHLFDTSHSDYASPIKSYFGYRNFQTVKGINFYGPSSEFIMSGSDCGHIFFWDKNSEKLVNVLLGEERGVVNALVSHPHCSVLATGGLEPVVKLWAPVGGMANMNARYVQRVLRSNARHRYRRNIMFTARGQIPSATGATAERVVRFRPPAIIREEDIEAPEWRQNGDFPPECHMS
ncbi:DDB1- and CUL4-associated factor 8 [Trichinella zimbabwensis]|uniref:DDB1-and CUL4-associated factor 8 n=1 Tax=Trichinella zimbabwensis TaxID=268475 RepID=A0A0V1I735_9BILA|nr:DDB1- and CUL4-associated factor 8 [Trichinella zimbabwensis]KRZ18210.1 DDB1- and CUL4-associated factor 8 [Trichinella zimbabwensis]